MRMRPLSTGLAGLTVCFAGVSAITAQDHPPCAAIAEQSPAGPEAWHQTKLAGNPNCGTVPLAMDTVRLSCEAPGLLDASALSGERAAFEAPTTVTIAGEVREPHTAALREGMTLSDLITQAGRLNRTANLTLEVYRVFRTGDGERQTIPEIHSIRVDSTYLVNRVAGRIYASYIPGFTYMVDRASAFKLRPCDRVVVMALHRRRVP